jgi:NAD-dependent deacetylase
LKKDPAAFWEWMQYRRKIIENCFPNAAHESLSRFENERAENFQLITTNVDGLHGKAGSKSHIELHGNIWRVRCTRCEYRSPYLDTNLNSLPPKCPSCNHNLRPNIVLFEESLARADLERAIYKCNRAEVLVVMGSSNLVQPASDLPFRAKQAGAKVISINPASTNIDQICHVIIKEKAAIALPVIDRILHEQ